METQQLPSHVVSVQTGLILLEVPAPYPYGGLTNDEHTGSGLKVKVALGSGSNDAKAWPNALAEPKARRPLDPSLTPNSSAGPYFFFIRTRI